MRRLPSLLLAPSTGKCASCLGRRGAATADATRARLGWVPPATGSSSSAADSGFARTPRFEDDGPVAWSIDITKSHPTNVSGTRLASKRVQRITEEIQAFVEECEPQADAIARRDNFVHKLQTFLSPELPNGCTLVPFGSAANGLWLPDSDLDISVVDLVAESRLDCINLLRRIGAVIHRNTGDRPTSVFKASVPLLRWAPVGSGMPGNCDMSVNNSLAVENSRLVGHYVATDDRVRSLVLIIKSWARARSINDRSRGTLSSFALTLMLIHFLQRRLVLPNLQDLAVRRDEPSQEVDGFDCRFCTDPVAIHEALERLRAAGAPLQSRTTGVSPKSDDSVGALLLAFFKFFGSEYRGGVISIRGATQTAAAAAGGGPFLFVENPFEHGRDVANVDAGQQLRLRGEFKRAYRHLLQRKPLADLVSSRASNKGQGDDVDAEVASREETRSI